MRTLKSLKLLSVLFAAFVSLDASGQKAAVKTNLLYDIAAYTANLGVEIGLAPRWTLDVSANYNGWTLSDNRRWKHWVVQPEARYWLCDRFAGHFFGLHAHGGQFNIGGLKNGISFLGSDFSKLENRRYQGLARRRRHRLRILVDSGQALESRSRDRPGIHLHPLRHLSLRRLRPQDKPRTARTTMSDRPRPR